MKMFDQLVGGISGAQITSLVNTLVDKHGGVQGIVALLQQQGLRETVKSWVESGPNLPISADQVHQVFGADTMQDLAAKAGMGPQHVAQKLSLLLPQAIDALTPGGEIPRI